MSDDAQYRLGIAVAQNKLRRGWIIRILDYFNHQHSREVNDKVILDGLVGNGHRVPLATLHADLRYLEERGFVRLREGIPGLLIASITADGVLVHEKVISDPGIVVGER